MPDTHATGNPVFDYRAGFRAFAVKLQRVLIGGGLLLAIAGAITFATAFKCVAAISVTAGMCLVAVGIAWGFYFRKKMRTEFQLKFKD